MSLTNLKTLLGWFSSSTFTLVCIALALVLVTWGTVAQVSIGAYAAQRVYFSSFFIWASWADIKLPVFPGGLSVGIMWLLALCSSFICRHEFFTKHLGALLTHVGIALLLIGQGYAQLFSEETVMPIELGQTVDYSESRTQLELVFVDEDSANQHKAISVPLSKLVEKNSIDEPTLPFIIYVHKIFPKAKLYRLQSGQPGLATRGIGAMLGVDEQPQQMVDGEDSSTTILLEVLARGRSQGRWLASTEITEPQELDIEGKRYGLSLRFKRSYFPFSLTLNKFSHDVYPGTEIPKNFSSAIRLENHDTAEVRDVLIYMNHPLRYGGFAFYQASYGKNNTLSVLQVVRNPGWLLPYLSCLLVAIGLLVEYGIYFLKGARRQHV